MQDMETVIKGLEETETMLIQAVDRYGEMSALGALKCLNRVTDTIALLKEQEVKTGHWIIVEYDSLTCSCCGKSYYTGCDSTKEATANLEKGNVYCYCPHCGSKMERR